MAQDVFAWPIDNAMENKQLERYLIIYLIKVITIHIHIMINDGIA